MAILQKRTSKKQLPQARGLERSPLSSIISNVENAKPNAGFFDARRPETSRITSAGGVKPISKINQRENIASASLAKQPSNSLLPTTSKLTSATKPVTTKQATKPATKPAVTKTPLTTKPSLTSKTTTPTTKTTTPTKTTTSTTKPSITTKATAPTATTKTTSPTTTTKPTVTKTTGTNNSLTSKITNALTGAAIGAGTKLLVDKITGKPTTGSKPTNTPTTTTPKTTPSTKPTAPTGKVTPKTTSPVTSKVLTQDEIDAELARVKASEENLGLPEGAVDNGDGTYSVSDGEFKTIYDASGNIVGMEATDTATDNVASTDNSGDQYFTDDDGNVWLFADGQYTLAQSADDTDTTVSENTWTDPDTGEVWTLGDNGEWTTDYTDGDTTVADNTDETNNTDETDNSNYIVAGNDDYSDDNPDTEVKRGGLITMMKDGGIPHYKDGTDEEDVADTGGDSMNGEEVDWTDNGDGTASYWDGSEYVTVDSETGNELWRTDDNGEIISGQEDYDKQMQINDYLDRYSDGNRLLNTVTGGGKTGNVDNKLDNSFLNTITGALGTTAGAAGAGALLASLLGGDFGGGTGNQNQGVDMSKVGVINPRTTDFGIGPTRYVGYEDYGVAPDEDYAPNEELLKNLNAPGYNPVNEGDYGYADEAETNDNPDEEGSEIQMAAGGLSSMAPQPTQTHYTFGKPADVYANLGLREAPMAEPVDQPRPVEPPQSQQQPQGQQPQQGQQAPTGMPMGLQKPPLQQMGAPLAMPPQPPAGIPKGVPPAGAMRKGGLPHVSNVPVVEGRYDFRNGSAVHGEGDGQSDDIPAMLADGEYVIDAETVAQIGNGSTKAGAQALDKFRENIRAHKRSAPLNKIPPKTKTLTSYLKGAK